MSETLKSREQRETKKDKNYFTSRYPDQCPRNSMYSIQIGFLGTVQGKFVKYPGPPSCKNATTQFHKQIPNQHPRPHEINVHNSDWICGNVPGGNLLKYTGPPSCKNAKTLFHKSTIPKKPPTPYEIHVPNSDLIFGAYSREICQVPWASLLQKCNNAIS